MGQNIDLNIHDESKETDTCFFNMCVCVSHPSGANVTTTWLHLTDHDIMVFIGPFPSLPSLPPFISTDAELSVLVGHYLCLHTWHFQCVILPVGSSFFFCFFKVCKGNLFKRKNVENNLPKKEKDRKVVKLGHSECDWCVCVPDTALAEAHPLKRGNHGHIPPKITT